MLAQIAEAYRRTRKPRDILWNRFFARPLAAALVVPLARTAVTPNQITFASLALFFVAAVMLVALPSWHGLLAAVAVLELSYVLDCADGQLARWKGVSSPAGAHLDFLADELKAFALVPAVGVRLFRASGDPAWALEASFATAALATALAMTTFMRRPEVIAATGRAGPRAAGDYANANEAPAESVTQEPAPRRSALASLIALVENAGRFVVHYPSYLPVLALLNRMDLFLHAYLIVNLAHTARSLALVTLRLGRPRARS
jgi:phosphatidylglycerophosphate synthase